MDKKEEYIKNIKASVDSMMVTEKKDDWSWVDAIQMAMPVYTRLGVVYKDTKYFDRMYEMYAFTKYKHGGNGLYDPKTDLWWRDKDFVYPAYKEPNGEGCYWSRGNGWVVAALVRVLELLPKSDPHYQEYLTDFQKMCKALLPLQREDGFWNVSLKDPNNFGGKELTGTSCSLMVLPGASIMDCLIKNNLLPRSIKHGTHCSKIVCIPMVNSVMCREPVKNPKKRNPLLMRRHLILKILDWVVFYWRGVRCIRSNNGPI
jgi:hypothetical protein